MPQIVIERNGFVAGSFFTAPHLRNIITYRNVSFGLNA
jgi:hypothetical protein